MVSSAPQGDLFPTGSAHEADGWIVQLYATFDDPDRTCGFLDVAEAAIEACPADPRILRLAAAAAVLDQRPQRALAFLKRASKRYLTDGTDHLLHAFALFQSGKRVAARDLLERHRLTEWPEAIRVFPGGRERFRWLVDMLDAVMGREARRPGRRRAASPTRGPAPRGKPAPAAKPAPKAAPAAEPSSVAPPAPARAPRAAAARSAPGFEPIVVPPLPTIEIDIPFTVAFDPAPLTAALARAPEADGRWSLLRERLAHLGLAQGFDELLCLPHLAGVEPLWHQTETVRKVLKQFRGRVLLADEVGLGKTIEAGMVLKEYALRGMAERMLVLTPASLVGQWREELETKFGLACSTTYDPLLREDPAAFWRQKRVIASIAAARRQEHADRLLAEHFDVVVVDEAHHLRDRTSRSWTLVDALSKRFLLLLSATPVQNDLVELYNLLTLLKPGIFKTPKEFRTAYMTPGKPRQPANAEKLRELMRGAMIRNTRAVVALKLPRRHATTIRVDASPAEAAAYAELADAARSLAADGGPGRHRLALQHLLGAAGSSPAA
ncbi:DEAD/DEAH box helicase, partial [Rhodoplanes sp. SY1]|uniref:DEAD/DEAH box helicase n=1 Tax=Rhodoplanes sp. SY1 TaxID=3166646 RepID=UPI0038B43897